MGVPCVATDIRGCRQVVNTETNGVLVPVGEAGPLAEAISRIVTDDALARSMRGEAAKVAARLAWPSVGREYLRLLHRILAEGQAA